MSRSAERKRFNSDGLHEEYDQNLDDAKNRGGSTYGILNTDNLGSARFLKMEVGKQYRVRFVPWYEEGDEKKPRWFMNVPVHKFVGPRGNARDYVCNSVFGEPCPLCDELERKASWRYFYNFQVEEDGKWEQKITEVNSSFHEGICKASETTDPDTGMITTTYHMDPDNGCVVGFTGIQQQNGSMKWVEPGQIGFGKPSQIADEWLASAVDFKLALARYTVDELREAIAGVHPKKTIDADAPVETARPIRPVVESPSLAPAVQATLPPVAEPSAPVKRGPVDGSVSVEPEVKMCSSGFPFGDPVHHFKHPECEKCPEAEYTDCSHLAAGTVIQEIPY